MTKIDAQSSHRTPRTGRPAFELPDICSGAGLTELLHRICHEVDNPLTAIISMATVIERIGPDDPSDSFRKEKLPRYGRAIAAEAWRASRLLEKLLYIASSRPPVDAQADLTSELRTALADIQDVEGYEAVPIAVSIDEDLGAVVGESSQIKLLISELLDNAHFSCAHAGQKRPVTVSASVEDSRAVIEISSWSDAACAFELDKIFEPFVTDRAMSKKLGIGLTLVHAISARFGGDVRVREEPEDGGFRFTARVSLPLHAAEEKKDKHGAKSAAPAAPQQRRASVKKLSVLVIEDEQTVASAIRKILELGVAGADSVSCTCTDGAGYRAALEAGGDFDAVLCDLNLREVSGRTVYETIKKSHPQSAERFAFLTGDGHRAETMSFLRATSRPYLLKPFEPSQLVELVRNLAQI